ncbi:hypothetical protein GOP47_0030019 [Adiantum capillus-veneris]|nr:hypothetical protein GOP47_0030019 [Adiantum capillus-veneris]
MQGLSSEDGLMCSSPVGSCTIERTLLEKETCKEHFSSEKLEGNLVSNSLIERDVCSPKDEEPDLPAIANGHNDVQEGSDAECHLCIELGSSQSEDPDAETNRDGSVEREVPLETEGVCNSEGLQTRLEENQDCLGNMSSHGEVTSEIEKHTNNSHDVEDDRKGEELSAKSSKEEDCWNSALTRESGNSCVGVIDDQAEKDGYIDLKCGCTSQKYGDTMGILRLYQNGKLEIQCQCSMGCIKGKPMSPASFERHSGRGASKKWRDSIWIVLGDQKVQFSKVKGLDAFVRRYKESGRTTGRQPALPKQSIHRDEFLQCKKCLKRRRFRRKTKEECQLFHEASMNPEWECSNYPFESFSSCQDEEEREARQANRGCVRSRTCPGCIDCVCLGCFTCRFEDCECRLCTEYIANNK